MPRHLWILLPPLLALTTTGCEPPRPTLALGDLVTEEVLNTSEENEDRFTLRFDLTPGQRWHSTYDSQYRLNMEFTEFPHIFFRQDLTIEEEGQTLERLPGNRARIEDFVQQVEEEYSLNGAPIGPERLGLIPLSLLLQRQRDEWIIDDLGERHDSDSEDGEIAQLFRLGFDDIDPVIPDFVGAALAHLPSEPVGVGDSWGTHGTYAGVPGAEASAVSTLVSVETRDQGRLALIRTETGMTVPTSVRLEAESLPTGELELGILRLSGEEEVLFNIDSGNLESAALHLTGFAIIRGMFLHPLRREWVEVRVQSSVGLDVSMIWSESRLPAE